MRRKILGAVAALAWVSGNAAAQEQPFDAEQFAKDLNAAIKSDVSPGVTVSGVDVDARFVPSWTSQVTANIPEFGIVAVDANKDPIDLFGASTPYQVVGSELSVPGYQLPTGGAFKLVGKAGWVEIAAQIASTSAKNAPTPSIQRALTTIADATDFVADTLCERRSRPTKLVLHLTAGFELVFAAETGSQVEWDLEIVCNRKAQ